MSESMTFVEAVQAMERGDIVDVNGCRFRIHDGILEYQAHEGDAWHESTESYRLLRAYEWRTVDKTTPPTEYPIPLWQAVKIMQEGGIVYRKDAHLTGLASSPVAYKHENNRLLCKTVSDLHFVRVIEGLLPLNGWFTTTPPEPDPDVSQPIREAVEKERKRCSTLAYEQWSQSKLDEESAVVERDYGVASCAKHAQLVLDCLRKNIEEVPT